jgi:hypothetical protein
MGIFRICAEAHCTLTARPWQGRDGLPSICNIANQEAHLVRLLVLLAALAGVTPLSAQPDCGTAIEIRRVQTENAYRGGRMSADDYYAARVRLEESAAACRAGQGLPPSFQVTPPGQPAAPSGFYYQTTPQGLQIPTPVR